MIPIAKIVQLSDLHFVRELTQEGRAFYSKPFLLLKAKPHEFSKLSALAIELPRIEFDQGKFDLLLATGDLTTAGDKEAFETMLRFIESSQISLGGRTQTRGLSASPNRRLLLPGNHDRFTRSWIGFQMATNRLLEQVCNTDITYPYVVGYRPNAMANDPNSPAILFFVFDSTPSLFANLALWNRTARGRLGDGDFQQFERAARELVSTGRVRSITGGELLVRYSNCVRVATLHHHPIVPKVSPFMLLENSAKFIKSCFYAGIDLVLFGHEHKEYMQTRFARSALTGNPLHRMTFMCCPSTSQCGSDNGFYTFAFDTVGFEYSLHKWDRVKCAFIRGAIDDQNKFAPDIHYKIPYANPLH